VEDGGSGLGRRRPPPVSSLSAFSYIPPRREGPAELSYFHRVAQVRGGWTGQEAGSWAESKALWGWEGSSAAGKRFQGVNYRLRGEMIVRESVTGW